MVKIIIIVEISDLEQIECVDKSKLFFFVLAEIFRKHASTYHTISFSSEYYCLISVL